MPKQNRDRSQSKIVKMPQLHRDTHAADVWFEAGMICFEDPKDPNEVAYGLDGFLADMEKAIYLVSKNRKQSFRFYASGIDMDREPDEIVESTFEEMEEKYGQSV